MIIGRYINCHYRDFMDEYNDVETNGNMWCSV